MRDIAWVVVKRLIVMGIWTPPEGWDGSLRRVALDLLGPVAVIVVGVAALVCLKLLAAAILSR